MQGFTGISYLTISPNGTYQASCVPAYLRLQGKTRGIPLLTVVTGCAARAEASISSRELIFG